MRAFAIASRSQSYRQAAARLGTTHPTVHRRLASLEASAGFRLFHRDVPGLRPTPEGQQLLDAVQEVERAMARFARRLCAADDEVRGPIRATMSITTALGLAPAFAAFAKAWPEVELRDQRVLRIERIGQRLQGSVHALPERCRLSGAGQSRCY